MAGTTKEILFSAKDNGVASTMSKIRQSAKEMGDAVAREASSTLRSQQDIIRGYEEQINLLRKKNAMHRDTGGGQASQFQSSQIPTSGGRQQGIKNPEFAQAAKSDNEMVRLLKEISDQLKLQSRVDAGQELRDAEGNKVIVGGAGGTGRGGRDGGEAGEDSRGGRKGGGLFGGKGGGTGGAFLDVVSVAEGFRSLRKAPTRADQVSGAGDMLMNIPVVGWLLGGITKLAALPFQIENDKIQARAEYQNNLQRISPLMGKRVSNFERENIGGGVYQLGFSRDEYLGEIMPNMVEARGTAKNVEGRSWSWMKLQKGTGMDREALFGLERMGARNMRNRSGAADIVNRLMVAGKEMDSDAYEYSGGYMNIADLRDDIQGFTQTQSRAFMRSGNMSNADKMLRLSSRLGQLGGAYSSDPRYKWGVVGNIDQSLATHHSGEAGAIQYSMLRQANPGMSRRKIDELVETGLDSGQMELYLKQAKKMGNKDVQYAFLKQMMPGLKSKTINDLIDNKNKFMNLPDVEKQDWVSDAISNQSEEAVGWSTQQALKMQMDHQDRVMDKLKSAAELQREAAETQKKASEDFQEHVDRIGDARYGSFGIK